MPTALECLCCGENAHAQAKIGIYKDKTGKQLKCITQHPGFNTVCLDEEVLETAYSHYKQQYGQQIHDMNQRHRYTGYRQFVRWIWGVLGKEIRVVIPSCAVHKIRETFPSADQTYHGFEYSNS
ncbi:hypothetical protein FSP39_013231 [Pinctada imbricata]|uniref:P2X purinoreceptor 7 intracellular domain-containing protein n=1 Tax=Pinctada imbricata TaxID=66713 RepID=A0AA89BR37_PINIB|nr:hypothetical protein FSP39_013231 [Pinctada imbricata]